MQRADRHGSTRAVVVLGGEAPLPASATLVGDASVVVAADSGLEHARALGLHVDVVVGDLDSVHPDALAQARVEGTLVEEHPTAKDRTDGELALARAAAFGARQVVVLGVGGGRLDHLLANTAMLVSPQLADTEVVAVVGADLCRVVRPGRSLELRGAPGSLVSLVAPVGVAGGVTTKGLRWELCDASLGPLAGLGVSNELLGPAGTVAVDSGVVLVIQPDVFRPPLCQDALAPVRLVPDTGGT
ncbi:MAG: thiamine diphosphokinase [Acidimicrobiia bacterium]|nr:thiamine diphosphokinase [Acidimicrobiia bacterium]